MDSSMVTSLLAQIPGVSFENMRNVNRMYSLCQRQSLDLLRSRASGGQLTKALNQVTNPNTFFDSSLRSLRIEKWK
jgi:hypothetical protein